MNNQLENITTQYEKFRKEQRISHESFNKFLGYFDDQDRLSRTLLNGVGIACGFEVTPLYGRVLDTTRIVGVKINQGAGVTTDGTLMTLYNTITKPEGVLRSSLKDISIPSKVYTHYKAYEYDSAKFGYSPFAGSKIWELVTEEDKTSEHLPIETLADIANLNVFLHEEQYEKELKPCVGIDCDSHGIEVKTSLKVLLVDETRMSGILRRDTIFKGTDTAQLVRDLPLLKLKRPVLDASTNTWKLIRDKYVQIIKEKDSNSKDILDRLLEASTKIFSYFGETNLLTKEKVEFWYPRILDDINFHSGFQHIYNFINDLLDTYEELRSLLVDIRMVCVPDVRSFPKHLMLGKVKPSDTDKRHQFYYTGVLDHEAKVDRAKLLLKRFNEQITQFNIPYYIPPATSRSLWKSALPQGIRISPSLQYGPLGEKAIPHYYKKSDDLAYAWNFDATRARTKNQPMGYHYNHGDPNSRVIALLTGIVYNHDDKDFYRIEGQLHHGERFTKAFETLKTQINQFNLDFDVIGVSLTDIKDNKDKNRASYSDYIKQHPGITHMSGVPAGGTLVLVYESASSEQIIGDFALPYRCCTEKENTSVSLGASTLCNNGKPVPFNFEPVGATVEALAKGAKIAPFKTIGTQLYFDPSLVTGTALNEEITFKVNGKLVETKVTVKPALDLTVAPLLAKTDVVLDYESQVVSVKFKITEKEGNPLSNITSYEWSFGDGVVSNQIPVDKVVVHSYKLTSLLNKTVKPTLKIESKGGCSSSFTMAEIDIKSILETIDCLAKEPKNIDALGASKSISFLIDYGSDKGLAGVNSILTIPAASQQTISVNYNGTVTEKIITKAQESFSFKKNIEAPLALVTLKSSVSVTDWKVNGICPIAVTAESITIESNACSTTAGTKSTVYVKPKAARTNVLPLQNEDILYADDLLSTVVKSDGAAKFIIPSTSGKSRTNNYDKCCGCCYYFIM